MPYVTARQPSQNGQRRFFPVSDVVPFCEGWRAMCYGTPTLTELPVPVFFLFLVLCHTARVGVSYNAAR